MKRFMKYVRNHKGVTLVMMALMLAVLIMLASLAIDISYMYFAKNQLQVAADAAALAGGSNIMRVYDNPPLNPSDPPPYKQLTARQQAWKFACKNKAAGLPVFLVTDDGRAPSAPNCDNLPTANLNESNNSASGDIVVGHWRSTCPPGFSCGLGLACEPAGSGYFCPATGLTGLRINALHARPRRSGETIGMPAINLVFGKIFTILPGNPDWSFMNVRASAIAKSDLPLGPFPLCIRNCGTSTPLSTVSPNLTPGLRWFLKKVDGPPDIGWTTFFDNNTSATNINAYISGQKEPPEICGDCMYTTEGLTSSVCDLREKIRQERKNYNVQGVTINGWRVLIPIFPETPCPTAKGSGCFEDPSYQPGDPYLVIQYADVIITDAVPQGNCPHDPEPIPSGKPGLVIVGTGAGSSGFSSLGCINCIDPSAMNIPLPAKLVK
jgi:hypothetical protein